VSLPATLVFAVDLIARTQPELSPDELCEELIRRNWEFDKQAVFAHLRGLENQAGFVSPNPESEPSVTDPVATAPEGSQRSEALSAIDFGTLPVELEKALRRYAAQEPPAGARPSDALDSTTREFARVAEEMVEALTCEIAATAETAPDRRVKLRSGVLLGATTGGYTARWEMEADAGTPEGAEVKLSYPAGVLVDAEVVQIAGTSITLFVDGKPSRPLLDAELIHDATFLLDLRRRYVRRLLSGESRINQDAALSFMNDVSPPSQSAWSSEGALNPEQESFVRLALTDGVTWLWGPPGTGKTTTLAHLLRELHRRGLRTLFVSNTNAAVDTALLRLLDLAKFADGDVVRVGQPSVTDLGDHPSGPVTLDGIAAAMGVAAGSHLSQCRRDIAALRAINGRLIATLKDPLTARDRGWFGSPEDDMFDLRRLLDEEDVVGQRDRTEAEIGSLAERRRNLEALVDIIRDEVVRRGRILFATVHQTYLRQLESQRFDVVVIDEASMVSSDLVTLAAGLGSGHTVIAGDFRQLGPISVSEAPIAKRWLRSSPFEMAGMRERVTTGTTPTNLVALRTQHRMRSKIERIIGANFYREVGLQPGSSIAQRPAELPTSVTDEVVLVDTSGLKPWMGRRGGRHSRLNVMHAQVVDAIASTVQAERTFGAVSPFAPQARLLQSLIESRERHAASTVHRFQGGERDVMAWDMTEGRAGASRVNAWFDAGGADEEGARLVNVALSRARDQLYVVADLDRARSGCRDTSLVRRVLDSVKESGTTLDAAELLSQASGRTRFFRTVDRHPLLDALERDDPWVVLWCAEPPRRIEPDVEVAIAKAVHAGRRVYIRAGVPDGPIQQACLEQLQRLGCHVQLVRPCRENLILTSSAVVSSNGNLVMPAKLQPWIRTMHVDFAGVVIRMVSRRGDANPAKSEPDALCEHGHPFLVDHGRERDFRGRCLVCQGDVTPNVRTGRSRSSFAARAIPRCGSCGHEFGTNGWCAC
jgi:hypothetical protein